MQEIIENKDTKNLQKKSIKIPVLRSVIGIFSAAFVFSTIPNIEYSIEKKKTENNKFISSVLEDEELSRVQQIEKIYKVALEENPHISDEIKKTLYEAFSSEVIDFAGAFFTEDTIKNMYAVVKTERVIRINKFIEEHGWWDGDYFSYLNLIGVSEFKDQSLLAHEQLHAILKRGFFDTGLTNGLEGYGMNEAATTLLGENDYSYDSEEKIINILGLVIGYDELLETYANRDLSGLKELLYKYISPVEANKLIHLIDLKVFQRISGDFFI